MKSSARLSKILVLLGGLAAGGAAQAQWAQGTFDCITNNAENSCAQAESGLAWTFSSGVFTITNNSTGYVSDVYFDVAADVTVTFAGGAGTQFTQVSSPSGLPGGTAAGFEVDYAFGSRYQGRLGGYGINIGETARFSIAGAAANGASASDLLAGIYVTKLVDGRSEALTSVTAVPEPETYALMLAGLGAVAFVARRRRQQA